MLKTIRATFMVKRRVCVSSVSRRTRHESTSVPPPWRPAAALDEWVDREARPISLRQLTVFGRTLSEERLLSSAEYVRHELPTRIAHRLRNMQTLPYTALTNPHISQCYELYYSAFERLRVLPPIRDLASNTTFCALIRATLSTHLAVIPALAKGVLEIQSSVPPEVCDRLMTTMLRSRISRRVIAEQHLALTETFERGPEAERDEDEHVGQILLRCNAREIVATCAATIRRLARRAYGKDVRVPEVKVRGDAETTFPYIPSHIEYIVGELLRNSTSAVIERFNAAGEESAEVPPIEVLICSTPQQVLFRISDQGGGVDRDVLPHLWSFAKGPRRDRRLKNLEKVPRLAGQLQEVAVPPSVPPEDSRRSITEANATGSSREVDREGNRSEDEPDAHEDNDEGGGSTIERGTYRGDSSLSTFTARPPGLRLGIGLPMSKIYAEYWAGSLDLHSLEGYGTDAFLAISKLGNKNETLSTRATMDAI